MKTASSTCLLSIVTAICLATGCVTHHSRSTETYVAHAMIIDGPTSEFERIGWHDVLSDRTITLSAAIPDAVLKSSKLKVVHFPLLELRLGQTTEASNQHRVRYAATLDANGIPSDFKDQGVGQKIRIRFVDATGSHVSVDALLEDVQEPKWQRMIAGKDGVSEFKVPFFASRRWTPKLELAVDSWCVMGGRTDPTNMTAFAFKIDGIKHAQRAAPLPSTPQKGCLEGAR